MVIWVQKVVCWLVTLVLMWLTGSSSSVFPFSSCPQSFPASMSFQMSLQFSSVPQLCPTLCDSMNCSTPGLPGRRQWHPFQYSCLENPMDGGAWWAAVHGVAKSWIRLSDFLHFSLSFIGEGNGNPLQCSCLENPRDGEPGGLPSMRSHRVRHD